MLSEDTTERTPALRGILLRLPHGAIAFDRQVRVLLANEPARRVLANARVRVGSRLPGGDSLSPRTIELEDGRIVRVVDSGPGVSPEYRSRILEPFFRAGAHDEGFGLGLSIASRAVAAANCELTVDPVANGGRFTVRLRAATVAR
jgi:signal transduction histidine kinase